MSADSFFIHPQHRKAITAIYPATVLPVHTDGDASPNARKQTFTISVDQMSPGNLLQIRLCDAHDSTRMLVTTIDQPLFELIKHEQSLNVSFVEFVQHLIKILDAATKRADLHAILLTTNTGGGGAQQTLQFYERRSFRNLVHLGLPVERPSERFVLHYMQQSLADAQQLAATHAGQLQRAQLDLGQRDAQIADLRAELVRIADRQHADENRQLTRNNEQIHRLQAELKHHTDVREADERKHRQAVKLLQDTVDFKTKEANTLADQLTHEKHRADKLAADVQNAKQALRIAHTDAERQRADAAAHAALADQREQQCGELRAQAGEMRDRLAAHEKHVCELQAELEAEKHIARSKRLALELTAEEIGRANGIIVKQAAEVEQLAKKCEWRTEVALRQEQRIKRLEGELLAAQTQVQRCEEQAKENVDVGGQLQELRDATEDINRKYGRKIHELRQELQQATTATKLSDSTNRYLNVNERANKR